MAPNTWAVTSWSTITLLKLLSFHQRNHRNYLWFSGTFTWWYMALISPVTAICSSLNINNTQKTTIMNRLLHYPNQNQYFFNFSQTIDLPYQSKKVASYLKVNKCNVALSWNAELNQTCGVAGVPYWMLKHI